ncbi:MAG TPA: amidohydrolase family protein, partial [Steroidobacteraceae bacterium]|nr:amidohydrolase family protein [Steroidobacteraceae bacterium]
LELTLKGKIARDTDIDDAIVASGAQIAMRQGVERTRVAKPRQYFLLASYAPTALQMLLMRYWRAHHMPKELATFPLGSVRIDYRGTDSVVLRGKLLQLDRYLVRGVIWGREALWLDAQHRLVALVGIDAEFDHFESVREGFESLLPTLIASAGKDGMAALAALGHSLPGIRAKRLALVGGTLIDGTGAPPVRNATILLEGNRISAIGPSSRLAVPRDATRIDVHGKTILPGLWDMHAHFEQVEWGPVYLAAGVTTVRDCGNEFEFITAVRDAIRDGRGLGPRILMAGLVDGSGPIALGIQRVDTPEQAKYWVDRYHAAGFTQMKIYSSVARDNVAAVAREAHALGMSVTGHIPEGMTLRQGIEAGMDQVNHIGYVLDAMLPPGALPERTQRVARARVRAALDLQSDSARDTVRFLQQHGVVIDPTVALSELATVSSAKPYAQFEPGVSRVAPELAVAFPAPTPAAAADPMPALREAILARELAIIGELHKAGIAIVAGTDQAVPGFSVYREVELYVQAGFTPMEAIQAATLVPARVLHEDRDLGTLQVGKIADLVVLGKDPLESIHNIRSVEKVVSAGVLYETGPLWQAVGFRP